MILVVDIGNTRLKWACARDGRCHESGSVMLGERHGDALLDAPALARQDLDRVLVANVAGPSVAERLADEIRSRFSLEAEFLAPSAAAFGVRTAYTDPQRLGVDRWVAMIAARERAAGAVCVISAGTAVTFDAVARDGDHLGGLILPGPRLMADALERNTERIGATEVARIKPEGVAVLGRSTNESVGHAALLAIAAAMDKAVAIAATAAAEAPQALLTGGDAGLLEGWLETEVEIRADLVLEGLALIADDRRIER